MAEPETPADPQFLVTEALQRGYEDLILKMHAAQRVPMPGAEVRMEFGEPDHKTNACTFTLSIDTIPLQG